MSLRNFLEKIDQINELNRVKEEVAKKYEIASKLKASEDALLFENVKNHDIRVAGGLYGTRKRISKGLGVSKNQLIDRMRESLSNLKKPKMTSEAPVQETIEEKIDLEKYPILKHFEKDGGPYTTSTILVAKDSDGNRNLSFHRMQLIGKDRFAVRLVPRNLHKMFKEAENQGESLEVAAIIGAHPGLALAAATSPDYEVDEYEIAANLSDGLELTEGHSVELEVPAHSEIIFEGELLANERASEGPFADITGTYDAVREQPVFQVKCITRRENAIYQAILPGSSEHRLLMGMPREPLIFEEVNKVSTAEDVAMTPGGCGWLHAVISINKENSEEGKKAIEAAFEAHSSLKHAIIVNDDIDIHDSQDVEWAIATRARADEDVIIKSGVKGSSLDPTADPETRVGSKMGIDATKDLEDSEKFERAHIPK